LYHYSIHGAEFVPEDAPETLSLLLPRPEIRRNLNDDTSVWQIDRSVPHCENAKSRNMVPAKGDVRISLQRMNIFADAHHPESKTTHFKDE